jgi:hypothetical protein
MELRKLKKPPKQAKNKLNFYFFKKKTNQYKKKKTQKNENNKFTSQKNVGDCHQEKLQPCKMRQKWGNTSSNNTKGSTTT